HGLDAHHAAGGLAFTGDEFLGGDGELALAPFLVAGGGAQLDGPVRPGQRAVLLFGRLGQQLELGHADRAVAVGRAHAVGAGVAPADHDDVLALGTDLVL